MTLISEAMNGGDPAADRDMGRDAATMRNCANDSSSDTFRPTANRQRRMNAAGLSFVVPGTGRRKVAEIRRSDNAARRHSLHDTRYRANRTPAVLSKMFDLAEMRGLRRDGSNPCLRVKRYREEKRER